MFTMFRASFRRSGGETPGNNPWKLPVFGALRGVEYERKQRHDGRKLRSGRQLWCLGEDQPIVDVVAENHRKTMGKWRLNGVL